MSALTVSRNVAIPVMIGRGTYMRDALLTLKKAEKYGRAFSGDGSLTVVYARGKYTLS